MPSDADLRGYKKSDDEKSGFHREQFRLARVRVVAAEDLAKKDLFGFSDPYVTVELRQGYGVNGHLVDQVKTKTIKKNLNPKWNEEWIFRIRPTFKHSVVLRVYDENRLTRDDFLGQVELPLDSKVPVERGTPALSPKAYKLRPRSNKSKVKGKLLIHVSFLQSQSDSNGTSNSSRSASSNQTSSTQHATDRPSPSTDFSGLEPVDGASGIEYSDVERVDDAGPLPTDTSDVERVGHDMEDFTATLALPEGWEERRDGNGRTFYVDHSNRRTQWEHPQLTQNILRANREAQESEASNRRSEDYRRRQHISVEDEQRRGDDESPSDDTTDAGQDAATNTESSGAAAAPSSASPSSNGDKKRESRKLPEGWSKKRAPNGRIFYINHKDKSTTWTDPRTGKDSSIPGQRSVKSGKPKQDDGLGPLPAGWEERVHSDGRTFFIDHNSKKTQWNDPRMDNPTIAGAAIPYSRDYKWKYDYLKNELMRNHRAPAHPKDFLIRVRRRHIFEDSFRHIQMPASKAHVLRAKLNIDFDNERGLDYGGVSREWFYLLSKEMFNPYYGFFEYSAMDNYTLQINPLSKDCNENHLAYFKFFGRVGGMAVYHGKLLDAFFIRPFYKMLLDKPMKLADMQSVDAEYYNSLTWIKDNDPVDLDLTFQVEEEKYGVTETHELIPGGASITVTQENKTQYIDAIINHRFVNRVKEQMAAFKEGFDEVVPLTLLKVFDEGELELLLGGIGQIDVRDWKRNTEYKGDYYENHKVIQWFWRLVLSFNNEMRARLLQFVTGTSRVPMNGFKELYGSNGPKRFTIEQWGAQDAFPRAHTCFNRIDLPPYTSYEQLREKVVGAIEGTEGFAGVD